MIKYAVLLFFVVLLISGCPAPEAASQPEPEPELECNQCISGCLDPNGNQGIKGINEQHCRLTECSTKCPLTGDVTDTIADAVVEAELCQVPPMGLGRQVTFEQFPDGTPVTITDNDGNYMSLQGDEFYGWCILLYPQEPPCLAIQEETEQHFLWLEDESACVGHLLEVKFLAPVRSVSFQLLTGAKSGYTLKAYDAYDDQGTAIKEETFNPENGNHTVEVRLNSSIIKRVTLEPPEETADIAVHSISYGFEY